ncbi:hypothetical protein EMIT0P4_110116 [Pseudomonas sp. IT-P4]
MDSVDASSNAPMRELARYLGFDTHNDPDDSRQVIHRLYLKKIPPRESGQKLVAGRMIFRTAASCLV